MNALPNLGAQAWPSRGPSDDAPLLRTELPEFMRALVLDGTGFDRVGIRSIKVPRPGPGQLVCRVDAAGICTSVNKLIEQGPSHQLMYGWNPADYPVILGDEGAVTVAAVGEQLSEHFRIGQRFAVQPAVDHPPINNRSRYRGDGRPISKVAVGYTLPGLLAEFVLIGEEVLAAGCLIPVHAAHVPYAHVAIAEPLSCVISAHAHHMHLTQSGPMSPRTAHSGIRPGSVVVVVGAGPMGRMHVDLAMAAGPKAIVVADLMEWRLDRVRELFAARAAALAVNLVVVNPESDDLEATVDAVTDGRGADDVIVAVGSARVIEEAQQLVARFGVLDIFGGLPQENSTVRIDGRRVHYREFNLTGSSGGSPWDVHQAIDLMAAASIDPAVHIAHVGDLDHALDLLERARKQSIEGKAVIYPHRRTPEVLTVDRWDADDERRYLAGD